MLLKYKNIIIICFLLLLKFHYSYSKIPFYTICKLSWCRSFDKIYLLNLKWGCYEKLLFPFCRRLLTMQQKLFAMTPIIWCVKFIHVLNEHKVFYHYHHTRPSECHDLNSTFVSLLKRYENVYFLFSFQNIENKHLTNIYKKVWKTLWSRFICGSSRITA